jgi:hypothetical protein
MYYELSIMGVIKAAFARKALLKGIAEGLDGRAWRTLGSIKNRHNTIPK